MLRKFLKISFVLWLCLLTECAVAPPDVPVCTELDISRGYCVTSISGQEFEITDKNLYQPAEGAEPMTWWDLRPTMIMLPYPSWVAIKEFIIKVCKKQNTCTGAVSNWERTVQALDKKVENKLP